MTYEEAKNKALKIDKTIDTALEYKGAYVFFNSETAESIENAEIVLLKTNGNRVTMSDYFISSKDEDEPKKLQL